MFGGKPPNLVEDNIIYDNYNITMGQYDYNIGIPLYEL